MRSSEEEGSPVQPSLNPWRPMVFQCRAVQQLLSTHPPNTKADSDQSGPLRLAAALKRIIENMNQDQ